VPGADASREMITFFSGVARRSAANSRRSSSFSVVIYCRAKAATKPSRTGNDTRGDNGIHQCLEKGRAAPTSSHARKRCRRWGGGIAATPQARLDAPPSAAQPCGRPGRSWRLPPLPNGPAATMHTCAHTRSRHTLQQAQAADIHNRHTQQTHTAETHSRHTQQTHTADTHREYSRQTTNRKSKGKERTADGAANTRRGTPSNRKSTRAHT
jgi:hypothetical protein